jgi:hypothetical protein
MMHMTINIQPPPLAERRPGRRTRSLLGGVVVYAEGQRSFPCTIRNITARGARIAFADGHAPPSSFQLINLRDQMVHQAHIVWASATEAGVALESGVAMGALPHNLRYLKQFSGN